MPGIGDAEIIVKINTRETPPTSLPFEMTPAGPCCSCTVGVGGSLSLHKHQWDQEYRRCSQSPPVKQKKWAVPVAVTARAAINRRGARKSIFCTACAHRRVRRVAFAGVGASRPVAVRCTPDDFGVPLADIERARSEWVADAGLQSRCGARTADGEVAWTTRATLMLEQMLFQRGRWRGQRQKSMAGANLMRHSSADSNHMQCDYKSKYACAASQNVYLSPSYRVCA